MKVELLKSQNIELSKLETNKGQIEGLPKNPRHIKSEKYEKLKKSIEDNPEMLGMREVLVYPHGSKFVIIGGNMRFQACKELQFETVPCKILDKDMTAEQLRAITIKDNVGFGEHDWELLANEWDSVELEEWGLEVPNFETEDTILEAEEDDYEEPENLKVDVVLGDLIEFECTDGRVHRLICGDSTDSDTVAKLMNGEKADMVFTSPPYNQGGGSMDNKYYKKNTKEKFYSGEFKDNMSKKEYFYFCISILENISIICNDDTSILWNVMYNANSRDDYGKIIFSELNPFTVKETIIWDKSHGFNISGTGILSRSSELIFLMSKGNKYYTNQNGNAWYNTWRISPYGKNVQSENHNAAFPIDLPFKGIQDFSKNLAKIYEPFCGTGTTMAAAHQLNRICYAVELDAKYCQVIIDRIQKLDNTIKVKINGKDYATT